MNIPNNNRKAETPARNLGCFVNKYPAPSNTPEAMTIITLNDFNACANLSPFLPTFFAKLPTIFSIPKRNKSNVIINCRNAFLSTSLITAAPKNIINDAAMTNIIASRTAFISFRNTNDVTNNTTEMPNKNTPK